ncbi:MAG TPA: hypothetical protein DEV93_15335 [Chloroflexi bacterium]|nr:hypothetical protein [Chloroflexota bacterium]
MVVPAVPTATPTSTPATAPEETPRPSLEQEGAGAQEFYAPPSAAAPVAVAPMDPNAPQRGGGIPGFLRRAWAATAGTAPSATTTASSAAAGAPAAIPTVGRSSNGQHGVLAPEGHHYYYDYNARSAPMGPPPDLQPHEEAGKTVKRDSMFGSNRRFVIAGRDHHGRTLMVAHAPGDDIHGRYFYQGKAERAGQPGPAYNYWHDDPFTEQPTDRIDLPKAPMAGEPLTPPGEGPAPTAAPPPAAATGKEPGDLARAVPHVVQPVEAPRGKPVPRGGFQTPDRQWSGHAPTDLAPDSLSGTVIQHAGGNYMVLGQHKDYGHRVGMRINPGADDDYQVHNLHQDAASGKQTAQAYSSAAPGRGLTAQEQEVVRRARHEVGGATATATTPVRGAFRTPNGEPTGSADSSSRLYIGLCGINSGPFSLTDDANGLNIVLQICSRDRIYVLREGTLIWTRSSTMDAVVRWISDINGRMHTNFQDYLKWRNGSYLLCVQTDEQSGTPQSYVAGPIDLSNLTSLVKENGADPGTVFVWRPGIPDWITIEWITGSWSQGDSLPPMPPDVPIPVTLADPPVLGSYGPIGDIETAGQILGWTAEQFTRARNHVLYYGGGDTVTSRPNPGRVIDF